MNSLTSSNFHQVSNQPTNTFEIETKWSLYKDDSYLAIGSHDNAIYIYQMNEDKSKLNKLGKCVGHSSYITHVDWSKDSQLILSNSGDYEVLACKSKILVKIQLIFHMIRGC